VHDHPTTAARVKGGVIAAGSEFGRSSENGELIDRLGVGRWPNYFAARGGFLGDVGPEVVAAVFGFFAPDHVARCMREAAAAGSPSELARANRAAMDRWGRRVFDGLPNVDRAAALAERVVAAADATGLPMLAGLRAAESADTDARARLAHALMCLREHRGGLYLLAVRAEGLSPLDAILVQGGEGKAVANGWEAPFAAAAPDAAERRARAEVHADDLAERAYAVLSPAEADDLAAAVHALQVRLR
jgi:hypothetical protein